ncbi:MAG: hypothetical protein ACRDPC_26750 [Solirubrobacteraceae bacterium]
MTHHDDLHAPDLEPVVERLKAERPQLTSLELDDISRRVRARAAAPARRRTRRGMIMKSRLAMLALLVCGLMVSGTGAGLAIQGSSGNGNAAMQQYPEDIPPGDVLGEEDEEAPAPERDVAGEEDEVAPTPQVERQVEAGVQGGGDELPFTGLAAIPIVLVGLAMTVAGVFMRRRIGREDS